MYMHVVNTIMTYLNLLDWRRNFHVQSDEWTFGSIAKQVMCSTAGSQTVEPVSTCRSISDFAKQHVELQRSQSLRWFFVELRTSSLPGSFRLPFDWDAILLWSVNTLNDRIKYINIIIELSPIVTIPPYNFHPTFKSQAQLDWQAWGLMGNWIGINPDRSSKYCTTDQDRMTKYDQIIQRRLISFVYVVGGLPMADLLESLCFGDIRRLRMWQ